MLIEIDLHVHTVFSGTGTMSIETLVEEVKKKNLLYVTVTDSGDIGGITELLHVCPVGVLPGIELSTEEGHFLVFCNDLDFLHAFGGYLRSIEKLPPREDMAVVWAHPWAYTPDGSRRAPLTDEAMTQKVLPHIHALEVFNGNMAQLLQAAMLSRGYIEEVIKLARTSGKGMVGGSDAHNYERFSLCWTEILVNGKFDRTTDRKFPEPLDIIQAIRKGQTRPATSLPEYRIYLDRLSALRF